MDNTNAGDTRGWRPIQDIANPGLKAPHGLARMLQGEVAELLGRNSTGFPGAQPVSFARKHLNELLQRDYYVCEKSDGIRYLLYLTRDEQGELHYLIDRKNDYWYIEPRNLHFPLGHGREDQSFHVQTLIDGELVMDDMGNGRKVPRFLVFDCLVLDGRADLLQKPLDKRLGYFRDHVMNPYKELFARFPQEKALQAFEVEMKNMQFSYGIEMMFREVLPSLRHGNDGLIFTCRGTPYQFGTDPHILKWKPSNENTVDFRMRLDFPLVPPDDDDLAEGIVDPYPDYDSVPSISLWVFMGGGGGQSYTLFEPKPPLSGSLYVTEEEWETLKSLDDPLDWRVVECALDSKGRWRLHRFRDDKQEANHISTVQSVMESIRDSVSERELLDEAKRIKDSWKSRQSERQSEKQSEKQK